GRSVMRSPVVLMMTSSHASSPNPCASARRRRTSRACARARGEPRVPMRIFAACKRFPPGASDCLELRAINACALPLTQTWSFRLLMEKSPGGESLVLGLETSCDETAAAVVARSADGWGRILSNIVRTQWERHRPYGGVVPEIAARAHIECLDLITRDAMREA